MNSASSRVFCMIDSESCSSGKRSVQTNNFTNCPMQAEWRIGCKIDVCSECSLYAWRIGFAGRAFGCTTAEVRFCRWMFSRVEGGTKY